MDGGGLPQAWELLRPAHDRFPDEFLIAYNLACYAAQMGRIDEAWEWLGRASANNRRAAVRALALRDDDLRELWPRLQAETASP
jgi:hypothetical protein